MRINNRDRFTYILKQGTVEIIVSNGDNSMLFVFKELHS